MVDNDRNWNTGSAVVVMGDHLKDVIGATDEELKQLQELMNVKFEINSRTTAPRLQYSNPSVVLDDFLYHGDLGHACNMKLLKELDIQHIINVCDCELDSTIKENFDILWINIDDTIGVDIKKHFDQTNDFIRKCKEKNEKVLVHCQMGISRSSSIVLAYLMKYHHDTLKAAYTHLVERRRIASPNMSFFIQLIRYENELRARKEIDEKKTAEDEENPVKTMDPDKDPALNEESHDKNEF